jgi:hypothetical protein
MEKMMSAVEIGRPPGEPGNEPSDTDLHVREISYRVAVGSQGSDKSHGIPVTEGCMAQQALAARRRAPERRHIRLRPGFVDKDKARWIDAMAMLQPTGSSRGDIGALAFAGDQRLLL